MNLLTVVNDVSNNPKWDCYPRKESRKPTKFNGQITSKMRFTNNRLTDLQADNTLFGSTKLCRVQLKKFTIFLRIHKLQ